MLRSVNQKGRRMTENRIPRLLTRKQAAVALNMKPQTLAIWACQRRGPAITKFGNRCMYLESEILDYIQRNTAQPEER